MEDDFPQYRETLRGFPQNRWRYWTKSGEKLGEPGTTSSRKIKPISLGELTLHELKLGELNSGMIPGLVKFLTKYYTPEEIRNIAIIKSRRKWQC